MYSELDLAYLAGLVDGEGCITIHKNNLNNCSARLSIGMTDQYVLTWIHENFGGTLSSRESKGTSEALYFWHITRKAELELLLQLLLPYLKVKKLPALLVFDFYKNFPQHKWQTPEEKAQKVKYKEYMAVANGTGPGSAVRKEALYKLITGKTSGATAFLPRKSAPSAENLLNELCQIP